MERAPKVDRRKFLTSVAVAGAATAVAPDARAATTAGSAPASPRPSALRPSAVVAAAESAAPAALGRAEGRPGSDFMVDVLRALKFDYIATNPASSCRGIHESIINYGNNERPELLTVMHEESGTGMAHGYATSPASRWRCCSTAPWGCSTQPWRSTTRGAIGFR